MASKNKLLSLLTGQEQKPAIRRGQGMKLSTETQIQERPNEESAQVQNSTSAFVHKSTQDIRPSKGYKIRTDIAKECKRLAVDESRPLYEVMEEALTEYLQKHGRDIK